MIGIDVISLDRIGRAYDRFGGNFLSRFLSNSEIRLCTKEDLSPNLQRIAGFWAAKEAIAKALGTGIGENLGFLDICLGKDSKGRPQARLREDRAQDFGIKHIALSITHDANIAIAVAHILKGDA